MLTHCFCFKRGNARGFNKTDWQGVQEWLRDLRSWQKLDEWCVIELGNNAIMAQSYHCSAETIKLAKEMKP